MKIKTLLTLATLSLSTSAFATSIAYTVEQDDFYGDMCSIEITNESSETITLGYVPVAQTGFTSGSVDFGPRANEYDGDWISDTNVVVNINGMSAFALSGEFDYDSVSNSNTVGFVTAHNGLAISMQALILNGGTLKLQDDEDKIYTWDIKPNREQFGMFYTCAGDTYEDWRAEAVILMDMGG